MTDRVGLRLLAACALVAIPVGPVLAAQVPTPGAVQETLIPRPPIPRETPKPLAPREMPKPAVPPGGKPIAVKRFEITGNTVFSSGTLLALIAGRQGRTLTLAQIYQAAGVITDYYRGHGYPLATVTVPAQKVTGGVVRLTVVEGRVGAIHFKGNQRYHQGFLASRLPDLRPGTPITLPNLERDVLLLNDLPGLQASTLVKPGKAYGTSDLDFTVTEKPAAARIEVNNYGREAIGRWRAQGAFQFNNPFGIGDQISLNATHAQGDLLDYGSAAYTVPVGPPGTRLTASYDRYVYTVDDEALGAAFAGTIQKGDGSGYGLRLAHSLIRSRNRNVDVGVALSRTNTHSLSSTRVIPTQDRFLNLVSVFGSITQVHADRSVSSATATFSTNFHRNSDGSDNNKQLGKFELNLTHTRRITDNWVFDGRLDGVVALDPLSDTEQFRIGGINSVRGYPSAEVAGDDGVQVSLELHRPFRLADAVSSQFNVFYDAGVVHRKADRLRSSPGRVTESLQSIGVGVDMSFKKTYVLSLSAVRPLTGRAVSDGKRSGRVWASLSASF